MRNGRRGYYASWHSFGLVLVSGGDGGDDDFGVGVGGNDEGDGSAMIL